MLRCEDASPQISGNFSIKGVVPSIGTGTPRVGDVTLLV